MIPFEDSAYFGLDDRVVIISRRNHAFWWAVDDVERESERGDVREEFYSSFFLFSIALFPPFPITLIAQVFKMQSLYGHYQNLEPFTSWQNELILINTLYENKCSDSFPISFSSLFLSIVWKIWFVIYKCNRLDSILAIQPCFEPWPLTFPSFLRDQPGRCRESAIANRAVRHSGPHFHSISCPLRILFNPILVLWNTARRDKRIYSNWPSHSRFRKTGAWNRGFVNSSACLLNSALLTSYYTHGQSGVDITSQRSITVGCYPREEVKIHIRTTTPHEL